MPRAPKAKDTPQAQSPPREVPRSGASNAATETRFNTAGMPLSSHNVDTVHPYVKKDVAASKEIPLYAWTEGALKLTKQDIFQWTTLIDELNWFEDPVGRYAPFAAVANRVLELAKGTLPGVPHSYPVDDIRFVQNDPTYMRRIPEHGLLGALRKPDLLILREVHAKTALDALLEDILNKRDPPPVVESRESTPQQSWSTPDTPVASATSSTNPA
ncbi:hypothetical protein EW026_g8426 [Hermanssonia centrifuga]|uniref:Uncharacterized protein n=1 Tax=Hermanssonia centrifuga TaxID=98765 RepID=A0A4S4K553_9APHY|nr:hypothetical protein EW026_g8426 [Hermanssonia centrifuga]